MGNVATLLRLVVRQRRLRVFVTLALLSILYFGMILPTTVRRAERRAVAVYDASTANLAPPRVFVAALMSNCAPLLMKYWIPALLRLVEKLGRDNVYVSILENGSFDETRNILANLETTLKQHGVMTSFRFEEDVNDALLTRLLGKEGSGDNWVMTDQGWFSRRISYLAKLRNTVMEPLWNATTKFDKVLFLNDVIFSVKPPLFQCSRCLFVC